MVKHIKFSISTSQLDPLRSTVNEFVILADRMREYESLLANLETLEIWDDSCISNDFVVSNSPMATRSVMLKSIKEIDRWHPGLIESLLFQGCPITAIVEEKVAAELRQTIAHQSRIDVSALSLRKKKRGLDACVGGQSSGQPR